MQTTVNNIVKSTQSGKNYAVRWCYSFPSFSATGFSILCILCIYVSVYLCLSPTSPHIQKHQNVFSVIHQPMWGSNHVATQICVVSVLLGRKSVPIVGWVRINVSVILQEYGKLLEKLSAVGHSLFLAREIIFPHPPHYGPAWGHR